MSNILKDGTEIARKEALDITSQINEILEMTRQLIIDLSPPTLRGEGLWHAIHWLVGRMKQRYRLPIELRAKGSFIIPHEELHVLSFNCVRELLFNIVKHANASKVVVALEWVQDRTLRIEIRDDGKGFPPDRREQQSGEEDALSKSLGLVNIPHQLRLFSGTIDIHSFPGMGTQIIVTVPIPRAE